jgi:hypothetical protein
MLSPDSLLDALSSKANHDVARRFYTAATALNIP